MNNEYVHIMMHSASDYIRTSLLSNQLAETYLNNGDIDDPIC